jgi:AIR synthase-related protein
VNLHELTDHLRGLRGVKHKLDIQRVGALLGRECAGGVLIGDDCAAIPDGDGRHLLLAIEGLLDEFVAAEPWFAGYCAVMVNVSDVYAMGGRPIAVVDAIWTNGEDRAAPVWDGMRTAAAKYGVPIVGGHTNTRSASDHLGAAILGRGGKHLLTSFDASPGDVLVAAIDLRGEWYGPYPYWNASTSADGARLRGDLEILSTLADQQRCAAAKDISMGGIIGTAAMFAECSGVGMTIDVSRVPRPPGAALEKWLSCFPSFGFLLAVPAADVGDVVGRFTGRGIAADVVGLCDDSSKIVLTDETGARYVFWDLGGEAFIGFAPLRVGGAA